MLNIEVLLNFLPKLYEFIDDFQNKDSNKNELDTIEKLEELQLYLNNSFDIDDDTFKNLNSFNIKQI